MKIKLNHFERVAGLFVLVAIGGAIGFFALTAIKQGWFVSKVKYSTMVPSADGIHAGTAIHVGGIKAGQVTNLELLSANEVKLDLEVVETFQKVIREDSTVQVVRPFVLGDKVIEITIGSEEAAPAKPHTVLASQPSFDLMDLVSGKKLGPFMGQLEGLMGNLSVLAKAFADPKRTESFIKMFDRVDPLLVNLNKMSSEVTSLVSELNHIVPDIRKESPQIGQQLSHMVNRLDKLTGALEPAMTEIGPDLPRVSRRTVEALDEMVVTLKAIQKSFLLSGKVEDVREEEKSRERKPASGSK